MWRVFKRSYSKFNFLLPIREANINEYRRLPLFPDTEQNTITKMNILLYKSRPNSLILPVQIEDDKGRQYQTMERDWFELLAIKCTLEMHQDIFNVNKLPITLYESKLHWILQLRAILSTN
jgi:hypothetical protein